MAYVANALAGVLTSLTLLLNSVTPPAPAEPVFVPPPPHTTVLFGGDMMFDRFIRSVATAKGGDAIFSCLDPLLKNEKLVVANLEGPITENDSVSMGTQAGSDDNMTFTFPTATAALLHVHNIDLVNVGNNHIENFGTKGVQSTLASLASANVAYFGDPADHTVHESDLGHVPLTFINYNQFGGNATATVQQIKEARAKGRMPIVYTHWGTEYAATSSEQIRAIAHRFVDAGAELIIGSHPHVVEEREFYKDKYIYYSLGNLVFDQYWKDSVTHGLMVRAAFNAQGVVYVEEIPVELRKDGSTCLASNL